MHNYMQVTLSHLKTFKNCTDPKLLNGSVYIVLVYISVYIGYFAGSLNINMITWALIHLIVYTALNTWMIVFG